jgi:hypothetical protein
VPWGAASPVRSVQVGKVGIAGGGGATQGRSSLLRILRGSRAPAADAQPDGGALGDGPVTLLLSAAPEDPGGGLGRLIVTRAVDPLPDAAPPPIEQVCATVPVTDTPGDGATPDADVVRGWFTSDARNVYATIEVGEIPDAAPLPFSTLTYSLTWRDGHLGRHASAQVDDAGTWSFVAAGYNRGADPNPAGSTATTGELDRERGLIRITVPRDLVLSSQFRDTAGRVVLRAPEFEERVDAAPDGIDGPIGTGGDWAVGSC